MSTVYLNGSYLPMQEAKISPMDRGFLFGDGIYEVIPSYDGRLVGFGPHMDRMEAGLAALEIDAALNRQEWREVASQLIGRNGAGNLALYFHVSRGADTKRDHAYPVGIAPTVYAFSYAIGPPPGAEKIPADAFAVTTAQDMRWKHCNIKSTALLGNVLHYQQSRTEGTQETILYNDQGEVTEAAACNVFSITNGVIATPLLDEQKLPGITRGMLLEILRADGTIPVEERVVTLEELRNADEVWLSSSSKDIVPVVAIDGEPVGSGNIGDTWLAAQTLYAARKFDF